MTGSLARNWRMAGLPAALAVISAAVLAGTAVPGTGPQASAAVSRAARALPLAGKTIGVDPGHNGRNWTDPAYLNRKIWNGREWEDCDTTGTQTAAGYTESRFNWNVARYLRADLRAEGARVVMTRKGNDGIGPCVTTRSFILNRAHAAVSVSVHADYGPAGGRGFTILEPVADGPNDKIIRRSLLLARDVHAAMLRDTRVMVSDYYGVHGYQRRDDLAGLNLTTMPKVLIECGNMNNAADARLLARPRVQRHIARALAAAITRFIRGRQ